MTKKTLLRWPDHGWAVIGDPDDDSYLALTLNNSEYASVHEWNTSAIEEDREREAAFAELLSAFQDAEVIDTEHLNAIVVQIPEEFDWFDQGTSRALYVLKSEGTGDTYTAASDDHAQLLNLVKTYAPEEEDTEEA